MRKSENKVSKTSGVLNENKRQGYNLASKKELCLYTINENALFANKTLIAKKKLNSNILSISKLSKSDTNLSVL